MSPARVPPHARLLAPLLAGLPLLGCQEPVPGWPDGARQAPELAGALPSQGTRRMAARLAELARAGGANTGFRGGVEATLGELRAQVEAAERPAERALLRSELGLTLLREGRIAEALAEFDAIEAHLERVHAKDQAWLGLHDLKATAYLRQAEADNCLALHGPDSCLFPLAGGGVHANRTGAERARGELVRALERAPEHRGLRWLLNLAHMALGDYPAAVPREFRLPPELFRSEAPLARFPNVASALDVDRLGMAGGVVLDDLDGDGLLDILTSAWGLEEPLVLYRNRGDAGFEDATDAAGLEGEVGGLNLCHADYDNDGDNDVLVLRGAWKRQAKGQPNSLLRNRGDGTFEDVTEEAGLLSFHPTQVGVWADYDGDGWLDLFLGNESQGGSTHPCELYRNNGDGTFREVASEVGLDLVRFVKGAAWGDYDADGRPDLFLSCFGAPNLLMRNHGEWEGPRFLDVGRAAGVTEPANSFPTWFFDYDNDGWLDLFVAPFPGFLLDSLDLVARDYLGEPHGLPRARLFAGRGDGTFREVSADLGLDDAMLAMGANFGDLDNDGFLDVYVGTGEPTLHTLVPNRMYRNDGGRAFLEVTQAGGFGHLQKGHGIAFGDVDNDGDEDVYAVMGGAYTGDVAYNALFLNPGSGARHLTLLLEGTRANRSAIGAHVRVTVRTPGGRRTIHRWVGTGGSFGSSSLQQEIGLGDATELLRLEVAWPGETRFRRVKGVALDGDYLVREGEARARPRRRARLSMP